ncbi:MAG TPA: tRNA preQ1(34) S-adenosylmethionine ribosyltransferase-isomerase QueA [Bryobacteraceae bacterium]|nr:tRNA preQ1(34) S-adenosylmethionine ribosyltransferase-isomerase QueA [Bryobacteraceae bacterium]
MDLTKFDYELPESSIAQAPLADRAASRMLVLDRGEQRWEDRMFRELPAFIRPGDCLVLNDSKVFPSRLFGHRAGVHSLPVGKNNPKRSQNLSGRVEVFLLRPLSDDAKTWDALVRPGRKMRTGERICFDAEVEAEILSRGEYGERTLRFETAGDIWEVLQRIGHVPLPPYIRRPDTPDDRNRYQTVFARETGSTAAPTAGLHFTPQVLDQCRAAGAEIAYVTLHVGLGTFQPVRGETLHSERFDITAENWSRINQAGRCVCVGTTSVRAIESRAMGRTGDTDLFIRPGFDFRKTGAMLTNFHLPQSSLLILVCALAGTELVLAAYRHAVASGYRFYSYGDCMLIV